MKRPWNYKDLTGKKFGLLIVLYEGAVRIHGCQKKTYWVCKCECEQGNCVEVAASSLISGSTKSCGCLRGKKRIKKIVIRCDECGEKIKIIPSKIHLSEHHFCNKRCYSEYRRKLPKNKHQRWKGGKDHRTRSKELLDCYIRSLLTDRNDLTAKDIPIELVKLKRMELKLHREIKKGEEFLNGINSDGTE